MCLFLPESEVIKLANGKKVLYNSRMAIGIFGGSFDPVHNEHVNYVRAALKQLHLSRVFVIPSYIAPHKRSGAFACAEDRLRLAKIAFRNVGQAEVSDFEISRAGTSYSYLTCKAFSERFPEEKLYLLVGADMLDNFFTWKNPEEILRYATLAVCDRGKERTDSLAEKFFSVFGKQFVRVDFSGEEISSTRLRTDLAFGKEPSALDSMVLADIKEKGLYTYSCIAPALALEKEERREHSYRVAVMATARARSAGVPEEKALIASALHDCAKYVPLDSPLLSGFLPPENVPAPVMHQYTGAYLAEHEFGIRDEEILDAIRFHASGRENMTALGKLVYLSDLLEEKRDFSGVEGLRHIFWIDLDECMKLSLENQVLYLKGTGKPVYPLTECAYRWYKCANIIK